MHRGGGGDSIDPRMVTLSGGSISAPTRPGDYAEPGRGAALASVEQRREFVTVVVEAFENDLGSFAAPEGSLAGGA